MSKILATVILNPFQPRIPENRRVLELEYKGQTVRDVFCTFFPIPGRDTEIAASVNGAIVPDVDLDMKLLPGDNIVLVPVPKGGGGSNAGMLVGMMALAAFAWWAGPAMISAMYGTSAFTGMAMAYGGATAMSAMSAISAIGSAAILVGGGLLLSSIFPQPKIKTESAETSPTYAWGTFGNATMEGSILPIIIGERRVKPPVISSHTESEGDNNYLYMLMAVSEGEVNDIYGVEINDQPISYYSDVVIEKRLGTDSQTIVPFFNDTYADHSINSTLNKDSYIVRETSGTGVNSCQVHISLPIGLWYASSDGSLKEQSMTLSIQYRKKGTSTWTTFTPSATSGGISVFISGKVYDPGEVVSFGSKLYKCKKYKILGSVKSGEEWVEGIYYSESLKSSFNSRSGVAQPTPEPTDTNCWSGYVVESASLIIKGSSNSAINRSYRIDFPSVGQYEIGIKIVSGPPENSPKHGSKAIWTGISEIINDDLTYPGVALLGLKILANDQLSGGMPAVSCIAKKTTHSFPNAGIRDITNPAWANYYVLTNDVWGGGVAESKVSTADFTDWAEFCDTKKLTCCLYIDQRQTYNEIKNILAEVGRGQIIQRGTGFYVIVDREDNATQLFTVGNIIKDSFKMNYLPIDDRANCIRVSYYDKENNWEKSTVEFRDSSFNLANKEKAQDITLYACDSKEIAIKHAVLLMNYNKHLIRTITFDVSIDALACTIGDIILFQHDVLKYGYGGRVVSCNNTTINLDRTIHLYANTNYGIIIRNNQDDVIERKQFTVASDGDYSSITVGSPFSNQIEADEIYSVSEYNIEAKPFRIISITRSEDFKRKITAIEYFDNIYDDTQVVDSVLSYSLASSVYNVTASEVYGRNNPGYASVSVVWSGRGKKFNVYMTIGDKESLVGETSSRNLSIDGIPIGQQITFSVSSVDNPGQKKSATITLLGEYDAIYENGVYDSGVFASPTEQEKAGYQVHKTLWLQEPLGVSVEFTDITPTP